MKISLHNIQYKNMRRVLFFVMLLAIIGTALTATITQPSKQDVVEPNHFYSDSKTQKVYKLDKLIKEKPIAIVLMASDPNNIIYDNKITINVEIGSQKQECHFGSMHDLCTIDNVPQEKGSLTIKCQKTPCDATWKIIQPEIKQLTDSEHIEKFYKISSGDPRKMHLNIICSSIQITDVTSLFTVYSDLEYSRFNNGKKAYILFQAPKQGHIYFDMKKQFASCASVKVDRIPNAISKQITSDLLVSDNTTTYELSELPKNDFRMDVGLHIVAPSVEQKNILNIRISAEKNNQRVTLRQNQITIPISSSTYDMSYAIPYISQQQYKDIQVSFSTNIAGLLLDFNTATDQQQLVEAAETSYFDLKKGEKLSYKLVPEERAASDQNIKITAFDEQKIKSSKESCSVKTGCEFELEAIQDAKGFIYLGAGDSKVFESEQPIILELGKENSFTKKMREGEKVYLKKQIEYKKGFQVLINTVNAIIYMATNQKCPLPSHDCHNKIGTFQRHFVYTPNSENQKYAIFMVEALDNCEFTISLIYDEGSVVRLVDSKPFAYLFDNEENQLKFSFTRPDYTDVTFNLVGPFHALDLIVDNSKEIPKNYEDCEISSQGFLSFPAKDYKNDDFSIIVRKRQSHLESFVHFLLIASTTGKEVRLQNGMTYYETLSKNGRKVKELSNAEYIFEFDTNQDYVLNFYSHNMREQEVEIRLILSASNDQWDNKDKAMTMIIDKASDVLDLSDVSDKLCIESGEDDSNCELFMRLFNPSDQEIDIAITLMTRGAIIQMVSGVWQSFNLHSVAKSAHFYFEPKTKQKDVNLYFKSSDPGLRLEYRLYSGAGDTLNPLDWPFPMTSDQSIKNLHKQFRPVKHISISQKELAQCFPFCAILMSILQVEENRIQGNFSLMASDSITQIPQKQKFDIVISAQEEKVYLVDLKYAIDQSKDIFFYSSTSMGLVNIYANVYSEKNDRIPDEDEHDFQLTHQSVLEIEKIQKIIEDEQMDEHNNIYLYIIVMAVENSKISLQFGFDEKDEENAKLISFDTFEKVIMQQKSSQIYYSIVDQPFELKITRDSGFPFLTTLICNSNLDQCVSKIKDENNIGTQILTKVSANTATPCSTCYYFFKITTKQDPATVELHLQSSTSEIELTQGKTVYDFTENEQANSYVLYTVRGEQIFVNVDVTEGQVQASITDLHQIHMNKTGKQLIGFTIPTQARSTQNRNKQKKLKDHQQFLIDYKKQNPDKDPQNLPNDLLQYLSKKTLSSESYLSSFGLSEKFIALHIKIKSVDPNKQSIYSLSYSSGDIEFDLQDGLITKYQLDSNKESTFYYSSKQKGHAYLVISTEKSSDLADMSVSLKYCEPKDNLIDEDCWVQFKTDKPPIKDKTPNPTIMYSLPAYNFFAISLVYEGSSTSIQTTLGINHQEVILLPLQKQFPFVLHSKQTIAMLTQISNSGYIYATVRKCEGSSPTFAYTFDYDSFQDDDFTYQTTLSQNPKNEFFSKVTPGTMYMKFTSPDQTSLMSVYIKFSEKKTKQTSMAPGGRGELSYSIIDSKTAELTFKPPVCSDSSSCSNKIKYSLMTATLRRDLYSQLVCPSNYFSTYQAVSKDPIAQQELQPKQNADGSLSVTFTLADQISFVGIKAIDSKNHEVFYQPIEVATLWGQLSRTSHTHKWTIFSVIIISLLSLVIFVRRKSREGYKPIEEEY